MKKERGLFHPDIAGLLYEWREARGQSADFPRQSGYSLFQSAFCWLAVCLLCSFLTHLLTLLLVGAYLPVLHIFTTELFRRQYCHLHSAAYSEDTYNIFLLLCTALFYYFLIPYSCSPIAHYSFSSLCLELK